MEYDGPRRYSSEGRRVLGGRCGWVTVESSLALPPDWAPPPSRRPTRWLAILVGIPDMEISTVAVLSAGFRDQAIDATLQILQTGDIWNIEAQCDRLRLRAPISRPTFTSGKSFAREALGVWPMCLLIFLDRYAYCREKPYTWISDLLSLRPPSRVYCDGVPIDQ